MSAEQASLPEPPQPPSSASSGVTTAPHPAGALSLELARHGRLLHLIRVQMAGWAPPDVEFSALGLLFTLAKTGPHRQSELADAALLDPSTVSRLVAQLVKAGLAERRPDPRDGRAVQLAATDQGRAICTEVSRLREAMFTEILGHWSETETGLLTSLITRLNDDVEAYLHCHPEPGCRRPGRPAPGSVHRSGHDPSPEPEPPSQES